MTTASNDSPNALRELLEEERQSLEHTRERAARATNPKVRSVLNTIVELRARSFRELQARLEEIEAYDEITLEMNQMFW